MPTVAETVTELEGLKHERAVWMEVVEFLSRFVDHEVSAADHKIVAEGCIRQEVPQEVVAGFIKDINEQEIGPLNDRIESLSGLSVEEKDDAKGDDGGGEVPKEKPPKKAVKARAKTGKTGKPIRAVPRTAKPKASRTG